MIVVIPMSDDFALGLDIRPVTLGADVGKWPGDNQSDARILRNQVAYVVSVRHNEQLAVRIGLGFKACDRLRQPVAPVSGETETGYEHKMARKYCSRPQ